MTDVLASIPQPVADALLVLVVLGAGFPNLVLRLLILLYPRDGDRRAELLAELHVVPPWVRPFWVFEQIPLVFHEGLADRRSSQVSEVAEPGLPTLDDTASAVNQQDAHTQHLIAFSSTWPELKVGLTLPRCRDENLQRGAFKYFAPSFVVDLQWPPTDFSQDARYLRPLRKFDGGSG